MSKKKFGLLPRVIVAIIAGVLFGFFLPQSLVRVFVTFNSLFGEFLGFVVPLIIVGLVVPAISDLGKGAGKLLLITALIAYGSTVFSGFFTYFSCYFSLPLLISGDGGALSAFTNTSDPALQPFFNIKFPPAIDVMSALLLSFLLGLGLAFIKGDTLKNAMGDFKSIIEILIHKVIVPLLPIYIFGVFLSMSEAGHVFNILSLFIRVIAIVFVLQIILLLFQFTIAGFISKKNPFILLKNMLPAYFTALGTSSSAATIPVTLDQTIKNGVKQDVANFVIPLCATIHLSGSTMKIVAFSMSLIIMQGLPVDFAVYSGFIFMLGLTMVAAPGVPGGAIVAALGLLQSMLGFDENLQALMVALYIAVDSFGTACNVTGDGAIAVVIDKIQSYRSKKHTA
ncbi:MAG: dicarboxylate/amino acid:cation symporter [Bacteroidales bacterium]|nr:dicarboxylate/amino acid:cation symporter [Bacteroidales bacterium]